MGTRRGFLATAGAAALLPLAARAKPADDADAGVNFLLDLIAHQTFPQTLRGASLARTKQIADFQLMRSLDPAPLSPEARLDYDGILEGLGLEADLRTYFSVGTVGQMISPYVVSMRSGTWLDVEETLKTR